jgi:glycosyltransferase involved in cell wall biosynthesis
MRLLITIPGLALESGGPSVSANSTASYLAALGVQTAIAWGTDGRKARMPEAGVRSFPLESVSHFSPRYLRGLGAVLDEFRPELVYDFGIWRRENAFSFIAARKRRVPWIVSPRGMLEPWSRSYKRLKKDIAWRVYQKRILKRADALVATSLMEQENLRDLKLDAPVWLVPNGVELPPPRPASQPQRLRRALFLSRLHPKKQPELLIRAWSKLDPAGWQLTLAGPADDNYRAELARLVAQSSKGSPIELLPEVGGQAKQELLFDSDLFVLPTLSENFGVAIVEALAHEIPVITTSATPWSEVAERGCGWIVAPTPTALEQALETALHTDLGELQQMGRRGRELAKDYSWQRTAEKLKAYCERLLAR